MVRIVLVRAIITTAKKECRFDLCRRRAVSDYCHFEKN